MVNGYAIGGGHVLHVLCDLSDRRRHRHLRPDRTARRQRRSGIRHRVSRPHRRREEGARDLVPLPPVHRGGGARDGARQRGGPGGGATRRGRAVVRRAPREESDRAQARESSRSTPTPITSTASAVSASRALELYYGTDEAKEGAQRVHREACAGFSQAHPLTAGGAVSLREGGAVRRRRECRRLRPSRGRRSPCSSGRRC